MNSNSVWLSRSPVSRQRPPSGLADIIAVRWGRASAIVANSASAVSASRLPPAEVGLRPPTQTRAEAAERVQRPVRDAVGESGVDQQPTMPS